MEIKYVKGDATNPKTEGPTLIVHCCNDEGKWGKGFVLAISKRWPHVETAYRYWSNTINNTSHSSSSAIPFKYGMTGPFERGQVQWVQTSNDGPVVCNLIGQKGVGIKRIAGVEIAPIDYRAIKEGLARIKDFYLLQPFSLHMPRMGCGLAGGNWATIEDCIVDIFFDTEIDIYVYDYE